MLGQTAFGPVVVGFMDGTAARVQVKALSPTRLIGWSEVAAMPPRLFQSGQRRDVSAVKRICPLAAVWTCPLMANAEGGRLTGLLGCPPTNPLCVK